MKAQALGGDCTLQTFLTFLAHFFWGQPAKSKVV